LNPTAAYFTVVYTRKAIIAA